MVTGASAVSQSTGAEVQARSRSGSGSPQPTSGGDSHVDTQPAPSSSDASAAHDSQMRDAVLGSSRASSLLNGLETTLETGRVVYTLTSNDYTARLYREELSFYRSQPEGPSEELFNAEGGQYKWMRFISTNEVLAIRGRDAVVIDIENRRLRTVISGLNFDVDSFNEAAFLGDKFLVLGGCRVSLGEGGVSVWNIETAQVRAFMPPSDANFGHTYYNGVVRLNDRLFATLGSESSSGAATCVWDVNTGKQVAEVYSGFGPVISASMVSEDVIRIAVYKLYDPKNKDEAIEGSEPPKDYIYWNIRSNDEVPPPDGSRSYLEWLDESEGR